MARLMLPADRLGGRFSGCAETDGSITTWPDDYKIRRAEMMISRHEQSLKALLTGQKYCRWMIATFRSPEIDHHFGVIAAATAWSLYWQKYKDEENRIMEFFTDNIPANRSDMHIGAWCDRMNNATQAGHDANRVVVYYLRIWAHESGLANHPGLFARSGLMEMVSEATLTG